MLEFNSADEALVNLLFLCKENGVYRKPAWQASGCTEFPHPILFKINNPLARFTTLPERKGNTALAVAESLWVLRGYNDLDVLPGHYSKAVYAFTDDGKHYRAGYGPRLRHYNGYSNQYSVTEGVRPKGVDQLDYVVKQLQKDPFTRQAVITIHDPNKDDFTTDGDLLKTNDTPCTRSLHFMINAEGKLDLTVHMRSNDLIRGMGAINIPLFTFLQQIVAQILGAPLGSYYHVADSLHYYDIHEDLVESLLASKANTPDMTNFAYDPTPLTLLDVDNAIDILLTYEKQIRIDRKFDIKNPFEGYNNLQVFCDYAEVFRAYWGKKTGLDVDGESMFLHPQLKTIFSR